MLVVAQAHEELEFGVILRADRCKRPIEAFIGMRDTSSIRLYLSIDGRALEQNQKLNRGVQGGPEVQLFTLTRGGDVPRIWLIPATGKPQSPP
jgi:hypothetical protein